MRSHINGIANLYYEFLDSTSVDVSGTRFANSGDRLWGSIGTGGTFSEPRRLLQLQRHARLPRAVVIQAQPDSRAARERRLLLFWNVEADE